MFYVYEWYNVNTEEIFMLVKDAAIVINRFQKEISCLKPTMRIMNVPLE